MERKVTSGTVKKKMWVKAGMVKRVTGWTDKEMYQARQNGWITWEYSEDRGFNYDLNSINPLFQNKTANHPITKQPV